MNDTIDFYWTIERRCSMHKESVFEILYDVIITYKKDNSDVIEWLKNWVKDNLNNLYKFTEFYKDNSDRCIMLVGNHNYSYVGIDITCRYDRKNHKEVTKLLEKLPLKTIHIQDNIIFSHAGVTQDWLGYNHISLQDLIKLPIDSSILSQVPYIKGGYAEYGSPIWEDLYLFNASHLPDNYYQIFGHTQLKENAYITDKFAD